MSTICVNQLTKDYGHNRGIFDVSFDIGQGECFGFLGPNGAGKTTTIRHIMGFSRPDVGSARINGIDCWKNAAVLMRSLGYLPGEIAFPSSMGAREFLKYQASLRHISNLNYTEKLLERFDLDTGIEIESMSLGLRRKLAVVTAFIHDPEILILDEPTSGLDPVMQDVFIEFIKNEKARGKTILLSSHIFNEVAAVCDRIAIIKAGRIAAEFDASEINEGSEDEYQGSLLSAILKDPFKEQHGTNIADKAAKNTTQRKDESSAVASEEPILKTIGSASKSFAKTSDAIQGTANPQAVIEVSDLTKDYHAGRGIFNADLTVSRGEVFGLVGTNGSGKTTTIRHLMGFLSPDNGHIHVEGLDPFTHRADLMQHISYISGEIKLPELKSADAFFDYQDKLFKQNNIERRKKLAALLKLDTSVNPRSMSKGMKQKTALIAALCRDAEILIMDEPTTGLDPVMRDIFIALMREEQKRGKTLFMSSHVFEEIEEICDRVAVIHNGRIVNVLSLAELKRYRSGKQDEKREALEARFREIFKGKDE